MEMKIEPISPGVTKVVLSGRMDAAGAARIDIPFSAVAGGNRGVIVDMSSVDFLASIGIRTLMLGAKTMQRRGGTLVLLAPQTTVLRCSRSRVCWTCFPWSRPWRQRRRGSGVDGRLAPMPGCLFKEASDVTLCLRSEPAEMQRLSAWIDWRAKALKLGGAQLHAVRLCLEEAVMNVIMHGVVPGPDQGIIVRLTRAVNGLVAEIEDHGPEFDPFDVAPATRPRSLEDAELGGIGLTLIRHYARTSTHERVDGANLLRMTFG